MREEIYTRRQKIKVHPGETALLPCHCPEVASSVLMVKVLKYGLQDRGYCIFYRENKIQEGYQHPSFKGRVDFQDPQMVNGNFSVYLRNVSLNDTGTYECVVGRSDGEPFKHVNKLTVEDDKLKVEDDEPKVEGGHIWYGGHIWAALRVYLMLLLTVLPMVLLVSCCFQRNRS